MTGTTPPAPVIAKARAQEFQALPPSAELRVSTRSVGMGLCGMPYCLTQLLHHTVWHSASEVELPLLGLGLGLGLEQFLSVDPGIELGLRGFVTSRRYRQTNSAQALKETNRFTRLNARVRVRVSSG